MEEERGGKRAWESLVNLGKKEGYLYPLKNIAVGAENDTRIFRFKLEPDYPVGG